MRKGDEEEEDEVSMGRQAEMKSEEGWHKQARISNHRRKEGNTEGNQRKQRM